MESLAVVLENPENLILSTLDISAPDSSDIVVEIDWSGISTGTERLLYSGRMPYFPGMGYPLVPGYESVGRIVQAGSDSNRREGDYVFVPGANCFGSVRGLFGGAAQRLTVPGARALPIAPELGEQGTLLALAATAHHALKDSVHRPGEYIFPDLIIGHGVLGRLLARLIGALGGPPPTVWERRADRHDAEAYPVCDPADDPRRDYRCICDVSGDAEVLESLISALAPRGEVVLAGFYSQPLSFAFAPAFMCEARLRISAEWQPDDLTSVHQLIVDQQLSLEGLITHRHDVQQARSAYYQAFNDSACLKTILDWRSVQ